MPDQNLLPQEYPILYISASTPRQPVVIKGNVEGLCSLLNAIVNAIAYPNSVGTAEAFHTDAEVYEILVNLATSHEQINHETINTHPNH